MGQRTATPRHARRRVGAAMMLAALGSMVLASCSSGGGGSASGGAVTVVRPTLSQATGCAAHSAASWMGCLVKAQSGFASTPLSQVSIPGALNAGTNGLDPQSFDVTPGSACTDYRKGLLQQGEAVDKWYTAQDETITQQLDQGVRFLDLQVAYNGIPQPQFDWRVVNTLFSELPLPDYLGQIAAWAKAHPSEVVVVDFRNVCYEKALPAAERDLWSDLGKAAGGVSLADVAFNAGKSGVALGSVTLNDVTSQGGGGHNVVILLPSTVRQKSVLADKEGVHPYFTTPASASADAATVHYAPTGVVPTSTSDYTSANHQIESQAVSAATPIGSLAGKGLYLSSIAYELSAASQKVEETLFLAFGGLITPPTAPAHAAPAWESGLWSGSYTSSNVAGAWGHRANVVLADGVEYGNFVPSVIALNGQASSSKSS